MDHYNVTIIFDYHGYEPNYNSLLDQIPPLPTQQPPPTLQPLTPHLTPHLQAPHLTIPPSLSPATIETALSPPDLDESEVEEEPEELDGYPLPDCLHTTADLENLGAHDRVRLISRPVSRRPFLSLSGRVYRYKGFIANGPGRNDRVKRKIGWYWK
ncbi:hypothetical protein Ciccas_013168, partial [Cichlidogyrus casuarinus]